MEVEQASSLAIAASPPKKLPEIFRSFVGYIFFWAGSPCGSVHRTLLLSEISYAGS